MIVYLYTSFWFLLPLTGAGDSQYRWRLTRGAGGASYRGRRRKRQRRIIRVYMLTCTFICHASILPIYHVRSRCTSCSINLLDWTSHEYREHEDLPDFCFYSGSLEFIFCYMQCNPVRSIAYVPHLHICKGFAVIERYMYVGWQSYRGRELVRRKCERDRRVI